MKQPFIATKLGTPLLVSGLITLICMVFPYGINANTLVFEDNFDTDLEKWQPTRDDGSMWEVVDGAVEVSIPTRSTITELIPKDQYWSPEWKNILFTYQITPIEGVDRNTSFGWHSLRQWFELHFVQHLLNIVQVDNGTVPLNVFEDFTMENGVTYNVAIKIDTDQLTVSVDDNVISQQHLSEEFSGGKIGLKAGTGAVYPTKLRYDNVSVYDLDQEQESILSVPLFKQTDPAWAENEYNHAKAWDENPTIGRWGCLTSSIAMLFNYYGATSLPDGTALTPDSLNTWLSLQPDGYIGNGLVSWGAVTRLSKILNQQTGTPAFEYSLDKRKSTQASLDFIAKNQPSIIDVGGHFVVGTGVKGNDLVINDPAYTYSLVSQHQDGVQSTRLLQPSNTDLSYLFVAHQPELKVSILDQNGLTVENLTSFTERLSSYGDPKKSSALKVNQVAKPEDGTYQVAISADQIQKYDLTIYTYDEDANVTDLSVSGWASKDPLVFEIVYASEGPSEISFQPDHSTLRQALLEVQEQGFFFKSRLYKLLDRIALRAETGHERLQERRLRQIQRLLIAMRKWIDPTGLAYLQSVVRLLIEQLV